MRTTQAVIALVLAMSVGATIGVAQVVREKRFARASRKVHEQARDGRVETRVVSIRDIDLTDEQEARIDDIREDYRPKIEESAKELKTLVTQEVDQIRNVFTPEQRRRIQ